MYSTTRTIAGQPKSYLRLSSRRWYSANALDQPALDKKWRLRWEKRGRFEGRREAAAGYNTEENLATEAKDKNMYILSMFPYPSGNLHLGHLRVYTIADVVARFRRLQGGNVLLPMGWDAFGLPAENAAIERGVDPASWTKDNIGRMKTQLQTMNVSFDWSKEFATCDPDFYKQTQRIFLLLLKRGFAYRQKAMVNWDPVDKTVLANEQVDSEGRSWRSGAVVEQRELKQWFFRISHVAQSLSRDLRSLAQHNNWPERVVAMQRNWIGFNTAATYTFPIRGSRVPFVPPLRDRIEIYTTRPETIFAVQFIAISPNSSLARSLARGDPQLAAFLERVKNLPPDSMEGYRLKVDAQNPASQIWSGMGTWDLPVFVAPYVRGDYKTGAVMGVPGHDARDYKFWKKNSPPSDVLLAIVPNKDGKVTPDVQIPYLGNGYMTLRGRNFARRPSQEIAAKVVDRIADETGLAKLEETSKMRDWLISRQRYWGTPIPIVHCDDCGPVPVPDDELPVRLPEVHQHWKDGLTGNPLESATEWVNTTCPKCKGPARRDTDTMDTFVDSSWYYMRFADPNNPDLPISRAALKARLPVDIYIGGVEHAILHLLYARFIYKVVTASLDPTLETKMVGHQLDSRAEPFKRLITQGMVHGKTYADPNSGRFLKPDEIDLSDPSSPRVVSSGEPATVTFEKMSKSKHNGVDPTSLIGKYGADVVRAHVLFQAPAGEILNWDEDKIAGITRWLRRLFTHVQKVAKKTDHIRADTPSDNERKSYFQKLVSGLDGMSAEDKTRSIANATIWREVQTTIVAVTSAYTDVYSLNTAVSSLMGLTNVILAHREADESLRRQATLRLIRMMAPITPAFSEECWQYLRPDGKSVLEPSKYAWPTPDDSLRVLMSWNIFAKPCTVQINGKFRCAVQIPEKPSHIATPEEHQAWITERILETNEGLERLARGGIDIRQAEKAYIAREGAVVNYIIPKKENSEKTTPKAEPET
ncbi:leucyl-tRNA synthetase [Xylariaceae sp. FL0016]|nr:leucyl-tRNA synthetase [Xylariaceae sp. FL0016]